jgi:hypothetical protein
MSTVNSSRICKVTNKKRIIRLPYIPLPIYDVIFNTQTTSHFLLDRMFLHQVYSLVLSYLLIAGAVTSFRVITVTMQIPLYRVIKKSLCAPDDYSTAHNWWAEDGHHRIHSECGPCYTEHCLREHSSACQYISGDCQGKHWILLVTFCIVIMCTETLWSPCRIACFCVVR